MTKKKVLSIDDEADILKCISAVLERAGYEVETCNHPDQALDVIRKCNADMLTLDVRMPKISGLEVYRELKKKYEHTIPVLFVTAFPASFSTQDNSMVEMWQNEFADGNTDILYKPFDIDTLVQKVQALIGPPEAEDPE